jgi:hypothetical protein
MIRRPLLAVFHRRIVTSASDADVDASLVCRAVVAFVVVVVAVVVVPSRPDPPFSNAIDVLCTAISPSHRKASARRFFRWSFGSDRKRDADIWSSVNCGTSVHLME